MSNFRVLCDEFDFWIPPVQYDLGNGRVTVSCSRTSVINEHPIPPFPKMLFNPSPFPSVSVTTNYSSQWQPHSTGLASQGENFAKVYIHKHNCTTKKREVHTISCIHRGN